MNIGNRIIYDQTGNILLQMGEMSGDVLSRPEQQLSILDLPFGAVPDTHRLVGINPENHSPILEEIVIPKSPEQVRIEQLEDELLFMTNDLMGGIL